MGEEALIKELNLNVILRTTVNHSITSSRENLSRYIENDVILLIHGGNNFGDTDRHLADRRNQLIKWFPENNMIFFPQTIHYSNTRYIKEDKEAMALARNLLLTFSNEESNTFANTHFSSLKILPSADISFMLGDIEPNMDPDIDILILRIKDDKEQAKFDDNSWNMAIFKYLNISYKYKHSDWSKYKLSSSLRETGYYANDVTTVMMNSYLRKYRLKSLSLVNKIISNSKVIITDRLHASIFSILIGRPHVIINDKYDQISKVRNFAFAQKPSCETELLRGYLANNPEEAIRKAIEILTIDY